MNCSLIQHLILQTNIIQIVWRTVRRITNEILGVKRLGATQLQSLREYQQFPTKLINAVDPLPSLKISFSNLLGKFSLKGGMDPLKTQITLTPDGFDPRSRA